MRRWTLVGALGAALTLAACSDDSISGPTISASEDDYALLAFGEYGASLEGTMGEQGTRAFDGRTGNARLPEELRLTDEQKAAIQALREEFRSAHQEDLDALRAIFSEARAARQAGASREEVHAILEQGRPLIQGLRTAVRNLHEAINAILTPEQREYRRRHRPRMPAMIGPGPGR